MKWRGYYETFEEVDADNEDDAKSKLRAKMAAIFGAGEADFVVWDITDARDAASPSKDGE
jgi:hypothetical protein